MIRQTGSSRPQDAVRCDQSLSNEPQHPAGRGLTRDSGLEGAIGTHPQSTSREGPRFPLEVIAMQRAQAGWSDRLAYAHILARDAQAVLRYVFVGPALQK